MSEERRQITILAVDCLEITILCPHFSIYSSSTETDSGLSHNRLQPPIQEQLLELFSHTEMGFIMEFAENLILRLMEDPKERDRKFREHLYNLKDRCQKTKEMWSLPLRPYGFWTFDRHNAQIFWDSQISQVPGRRDPYDDLLQEPYIDNNGSSSSSK